MPFKPHLRNTSGASRLIIVEMETFVIKRRNILRAKLRIKIDEKSKLQTDFYVCYFKNF